MVEWHRPDLEPEDIAKTIREGREENDKKFENYAEYVGYIGKDNDRILNEYDHDHSKCEPNQVTKDALEEVWAELRKDRDERDAYFDELLDEQGDDIFVSSVDGSEVTLKEIMEEVLEENIIILDKLGSDFDEDGVPYWEKWEDDKKD